MIGEKKKMPMGKRFEKGNKMGAGRPRVPKELRMMKKLCKTSHDIAINEYIYMNKEDLVAASGRKDLPALDAMIISLIQRAIKKGCVHSHNYLISRLIGTIPNKVVAEVTQLTGHEAVIDAMKKLENKKDEENN
jgi:hypothetical protein